MFYLVKGIGTLENYPINYSESKNSGSNSLKFLSELLILLLEIIFEVNFMGTYHFPCPCAIFGRMPNALCLTPGKHIKPLDYAVFGKMSKLQMRGHFPGGIIKDFSDITR